MNSLSLKQTNVTKKIEPWAVARAGFRRMTTGWLMKQDAERRRKELQINAERVSGSRLAVLQFRSRVEESPFIVKSGHQSLR